MRNLDLGLVSGLAVAVLAGAAIGLERQWSGHASGERARFGGIRTFTLLGTLAGLAGWMSTGDLRPIAIVLLASACGLIAVGYVAASRHDIDATTEVAALVVIVLANCGRWCSSFRASASPAGWRAGWSVRIAESSSPGCSVD